MPTYITLNNGLMRALRRWRIHQNEWNSLIVIVLVIRASLLARS